MFIVAAVLVLVVGVVGRITYERVLNTDTPAYAQDEGTSSLSPTTTSSPAPTTTSSPSSDASASPKPRQRKNEDLMESGGPTHGPILTMPDGSCIPEYPIKRNGYCYR